MAKYAIVTDNTSALLLAARLEYQGHEVVILDTEDHLNLHNLKSLIQLGWIPARESVRAEYQILEKFLQTSFIGPSIVAEPLMFENHSTAPFVGFGESKSNSVYPLSQYNVSQFHSLQISWSDLLLQLRQNIKAEIIPFCEFTEVETTADQVKSITVNGTKKITADHFIFNAEPKLLLSLLPTTELNSRFRTRINRTKSWSRLTLQFTHNQAHHTDSSLLFLSASNINDPPLVGQFETQLNKPEGPTHISTWETYIDVEGLDNPEEITTLIRTLKRRIRKFFPNMEERMKESISLDIQGYGDFAWTKENNELNQLFNNFLVISPLLSSEVGLAQCVDCFSALDADLQNIPTNADFPTSLLNEKSL
jgi:hypothetical protein